MFSSTHLIPGIVVQNGVQGAQGRVFSRMVVLFKLVDNGVRIVTLVRGVADLSVVVK